ncbi:tannase/feruloyl esterase family alpha/beta hydrolase [Rugosimonospora acidiphila]|uniref:Tannase/feruloyl esterase family alpha/beta hydrolase n=1 Tax=Rugosimonospora acidiphila TaxID=556531 RepID=A0ABP9S683_9ACTN
MGKTRRRFALRIGVAGFLVGTSALVTGHVAQARGAAPGSASATVGVARRPAPPVLSAATFPVTNCASLTGADLTRNREAPATVTAATVVPKAGKDPQYCDVHGYVTPQVQFEVGLPTNSWNGDYYQTGGGGRDGTIPFGSCVDALAQGFAVAAQDGGHVGSDALWGLTDEQLRVDWAYRSDHVTAVVAKELISIFYGRAPRYSIMQGCSTGGREVESEVQRYPSDFDGAIAGDPAYPGRLAGIENAWLAQKGLDANGRPILGADKLRLLHGAVVDACDGLDGLRDGTIDDPRDCPFDPATLRCPRGARDVGDCLTPAELASAQAFYHGPVDEHGQALYPYLAPYGSELSWAATATSAAQLADSGLKDLNLPIGAPTPASYRDWRFTDANIARLVPMAKVYDPVPPYGHPDLGAFARHGGKLLIYQGWADAAANPGAAVDYYTEAANALGGPQRTMGWLRLFMVPGMGHCGGGDGPSTFDPLTPMLAWLRDGTAPDRLVASNSATSPLNPGRSRPLYPYPQVARYDGTGSVESAANFHAAPPPVAHAGDLHWIWDPAPPGRNPHR